MAPGFGSADLFRMIGSFALVLALMAALLWALRRLQSRMNSQNPGRRLQILESVSVGPRQKIALLRVGHHEVMVGITASQITALAQWPEGTAPPTSSLQSELSQLSASLSATGDAHVA
ncbi:MAG: Flagellar protein FliO [Pseudomonadota bacterium]|jgi:flagellar protein FliO/FliZ